MKKLLLAVFFTLSLLKGFSQTLEENKIDEFTKASVKRTSYEPLIQNGKWYLFFRVSKINGTEYLDMKMIYYKNNKYQIIRQGMQVMVLLQDDSVINLSNIETATSCRGCGARGLSGSGALGIAVNYLVHPDDHRALKSLPIKKIRIYTTDGYIEDEIKDKRSDLLIQLLSLVE